jgi:hypothetical protein
MKSNVITIDKDEIVVRVSAEHDFLLNSQEVAFGYGVTSDNIRRHKSDHADELVEGKHWTTVRNTHGGEPQTLWTKRGIIRLGFFIRSERAKRFRDAAEDLILGVSEKPAPKADLTVARMLELVEGLLGLGYAQADAADTALRMMGNGRTSVGRPSKVTAGEVLAMVQGRELTRPEWCETAINAGVSRSRFYELANLMINSGRVIARANNGKILLSTKQEASA